MASYATVATECWKKKSRKRYKIAFQNVRAAEFVAALFDRGLNTLQSGSVRVTDSYTQDGFDGLDLQATADCMAAIDQERISDEEKRTR